MVLWNIVIVHAFRGNPFKAGSANWRTLSGRIIAWLGAFGLFTLNLWAAIGFTLVTVAAGIWAYRKFKRNRDVLLKYRKGLEGERFVGEMLNSMSSSSTCVFHDIPGERFNVDYIIVSTRGVFAIETKHFDRTKGYEFYFDGNMIQRKLPSGKMFLCPKLLPQMDGEARFIHDEIKRRTTMDIPVIKVAIIIGCYHGRKGNLRRFRSETHLHPHQRVRQD